MLNAQEFMAQSGSVAGPQASDCLLVIDMQNDFMSPHPTRNPIAHPPFAATESEDIVEPICELMAAFHQAGGTVVATRDYHPWDHCSFMGHGNPDFPIVPNYPAHCVQGSQGSFFYEPICNTLCQLMRIDTETESEERVKVAFKGFHEDVDSFGGLMYAPESRNGRFCAAYGKSPCQLSAWSGAFILKASNMRPWNGTLEPSNVNAPPDVMAVQTKQPLHEFLRARGCKRVFVCGLVLDCCVVDTCLNSKAQGFSEVYMVYDSTRPAHVPGFGSFGSGFLFDPQPVREWISQGGISLVPTCQLLPSETMQQLRHRGAPVQCGSASVPPTPKRFAAFPSSLSVQLVKACAISVFLQVTTQPGDDTMGKYSISRMPAMKGLQTFGFGTDGLLSPRSAVTLEEDERSRADLPQNAAFFAYAYPVLGAENIELIRNSSPQTMQMCSDPNLAFVCFGGYAYFDAEGRLAGCTARVDRGPQAEALHFRESAPSWQDDALLQQLEKAERFQRVTVPGQVEQRATAHAWVLPNEGSTDPSDKGGFVFKFEDRNPLWFKL